ncbi:secreted RxLR effector protein 161-like [Manihot esculenta]|uniref:Uncharacterized protein n=1 Tax=Manihot esculenta TaxID=3983 RepID=A0ACB7H352_MANES|nr:secreted RxLR effector protein 161-like [Manihot esculenta]KAG8646460.1 hypothetical protein MANES_09G008501v8 [Manihot esculenta]
MEVQQKEQEVFICQTKYAKEILKKFRMDECKFATTAMGKNEKVDKEDVVEKVDETLYRSLVSCLIYLTTTRPDILYYVSMLSRFTNCATKTHFIAAKRVSRHVRGTLDYGIKFSASQDCVLLGYSDSDHGGSDDMKNTSCYCFNLESGMFSWYCKKQEVVANHL